MPMIQTSQVSVVPKRSHYDAIIVGGRCAGASTAMLLAQAGLRVLAIDRRPYGSDTLSTHALMRPAVLQLSRWGLLEPLLRAGTPLIKTTTFHYGDQELTIALDTGTDIPGLVAPRRTVLDRILVDAARAAGAEFLHDTAVADLFADRQGRVRGVTLRTAGGGMLRVSAGIVVGADGIGSLVATRCQAQVLRQGQVAAAHIYGYAPIDSGQGYHWYFREGIAGSLIPTNDGLACIVASVPTELFDQRFRAGHGRARMEVLEALSPTLAAQASRAPHNRLQAFRGVPGYLRRSHGPGWALVGDAGFFRDPITSHGISDAFRDADSLARAILTGSEPAFEAWQHDRDLIAGPILDATDALAAFDWTLDDIGERHRRFSAVMKSEVQAIAEQVMPISSAGPSRPALHRTPANTDAPSAAGRAIETHNRKGTRSWIQR
jgi:flavin-dependent dehydrogenase